MSGPAGVMSVIFLETAVGGALVLWASGVWGKVRSGFFLLIGICLTLSALGAWALTSGLVERAPGVLALEQAAVDAGDRTAVEASLASLSGGAGDRAVTGLAVFAGLLAVWQILLVARRTAASRVAGLAAAVAGVVALVLYGMIRAPSPGSAIAELALGSVFLGSTLFGLLLGHWYLVERRLSNVYMIRSAWFYAAGVAAAAVALALSARNPVDAPTLGLNPLLAVPNFSVLLAGGFVVLSALIAGFVWKLAREGGRSIQAATGYFYLAVIMGFPAELATKFRFF